MKTTKGRVGVAALVVGTILTVVGLVAPKPRLNIPPPPQLLQQVVTPPVVKGPRGEELVALDGTISVIHGDQVGALRVRQQSPYVGLLRAQDGQTHQIILNAIQAQGIQSGSAVHLEPEKVSYDKKDEPLSADTLKITALPTSLSAQSIEVASIGSYASLNLPCKFAGEPEPMPVAFYNNSLTKDVQGSLLWTWHQMGVSLDNSGGIGQWVTIGAKDQYLVHDAPSGQDLPKFQAVEDACLIAAMKLQPPPDISKYKGFNFIFSSDLGCCFWGGRGYALPAQLGNPSARYNYTLSDGKYPGWVGTMGHEIGHSLPTNPYGAGLGHGADAFNVLGDPLELMSSPEYDCPVAGSEWYCTPQGVMGPQLLRLGVNIAKQTVTAQDGVVWENINYLYPIRNGVQLIEVPLGNGHSLWIEARVGRLPTPDFKFQSIDCVAVLDTNEAGHVVPGRETVQDWILTWTGDGSDPLQDCGRVGQSLTTDSGWRIQVASKLPGGFRLRIGRAGDPGWITKLYLPMALG